MAATPLASRSFSLLLNTDHRDHDLVGTEIELARGQADEPQERSHDWRHQKDPARSEVMVEDEPGVRGFGNLGYELRLRRNTDGESIRETRNVTLGQIHLREIKNNQEISNNDDWGQRKTIKQRSIQLKLTSVQAQGELANPGTSAQARRRRRAVRLAAPEIEEGDQRSLAGTQE